jgi:hypothetical protein
MEGDCDIGAADHASRNRTRDIAFAMDFSFLLRHGPAAAVHRLPRRDSNELDAAATTFSHRKRGSPACSASPRAICRPSIGSASADRSCRSARGALVSWSGSMFEYLMPPLVMQERQGGILNQTNNLIVQEQMELRQAPGRYSVGHFGSGLQRARPPDDLSIQQFRRAFARPEARSRRECRHRALCDRCSRANTARATRVINLETACGSLGALGRYGYSTTPSTSRRAACPSKSRYAVVLQLLWRITRACRSQPSPMSSSTGRLRDLFHSAIP